MHYIFFSDSSLKRVILSILMQISKIVLPKGRDRRKVDDQLTDNFVTSDLHQSIHCQKIVVDGIYWLTYFIFSAKG